MKRTSEAAEALGISLGLLLPTALCTIVECIFLAGHSAGIADSNYGPLWLGWFPFLGCALALGLYGSIYVQQSRTHLWSWLLGLALSLVCLQRYPGSHLWPGSSASPYGAGIAFYAPALASTAVASCGAFFFKAKAGLGRLGVPAGLTAYLAAVTFSWGHSITKPLLEPDYPYSRHIALAVLGGCCLAAVPLQMWEKEEAHSEQAL